MTEIDHSSLACVRWGEQILRDRKLDWQILWTCGAVEGIALFKTKTIHIHWPEGRPDYALMVHEIAHAVCGCPGHDSEFAHQYMKLVRQYFIPVMELEQKPYAVRVEQVLNGMADYLRETADKLKAAALEVQPTQEQREAMAEAAGVLCRLDQIKRDLVASSLTANDQSEQVAAELVDLLGIERGS